MNHALKKICLLALLPALLTLAGAPGAGHASTSAKRLPTLLTQLPGPPFRVRPGRVIYTGDGSGILGGPRGRKHRFGRLTWHHWTQQSGFATGVAWLDNCTPSCAQGTFEPFGARVNVFRVRHGHFTRLTIRFRYHGRRVTDRRVLMRLGRGYAWAIGSQTGF